MSNQFIIWSFEHKAWWKENERGYTTDQNEAGVYNYEQARKICLGANIRIEMGAFPNEAMVPLPDIKL